MNRRHSGGQSRAAASLKRGIPEADTSGVRDERGYTLIELTIAVTLIGILALIAIGFHQLARDQAADATARANIRVALPAFETYRADAGTYAGMTLAGLQTTYSPGVQGIEVVSAGANVYCIRSTTPGRTWYQDGPGAPITTTACS